MMNTLREESEACRWPRAATSHFCPAESGGPLSILRQPAWVQKTRRPTTGGNHHARCPQAFLTPRPWGLHGGPWPAKPFGAFGGAGPEKAGASFESMGLRPGREMAMLAGATELGGGTLT